MAVRLAPAPLLPLHCVALLRFYLYSILPDGLCCHSPPLFYNLGGTYITSTGGPVWVGVRVGVVRRVDGRVVAHGRAGAGAGACAGAGAGAGGEGARGGWCDCSIWGLPCARVYLIMHLGGVSEKIYKKLRSNL